MKRWRVVGINFDHFHMGDNLRMASNHPRVDLVGVCDLQPARMQAAVDEFQFDAAQVFTDYQRCLETTRPDIVLLCPSAAEHGLWTERVAPFGTHVMVEKPFAASLEEADAMVAAMERGGGQLAIHWPMTWYPTNRTAWRLIQEHCIGEVLEVHYYDGNRGPLWHTTGKAERTPAEVAAEKSHSWFYSQQHGGGSLLDYLGYGTTLATWFLGGKAPLEVIAMVDEPIGLEVDEHAVAIVRYESGLSKFETRWGTFTDPWTHQPQPKCGFVIVGSEGTLSSYDFEGSIRLQNSKHPAGVAIAVDVIESPCQNPVQYLIHALETDTPLDGPMSPSISRIGQQIVDAAVRSAREKRAIVL